MQTAHMATIARLSLKAFLTMCRPMPWASLLPNSHSHHTAGKLQTCHNSPCFSLQELSAFIKRCVLADCSSLVSNHPLAERKRMAGVILSLSMQIVRYVMEFPTYSIVAYFVPVFIVLSQFSLSLKRYKEDYKARVHCPIKLAYTYVHGEYIQA